MTGWQGTLYQAFSRLTNSINLPSLEELVEEFTKCLNSMPGRLWPEHPVRNSALGGLLHVLIDLVRSVPFNNMRERSSLMCYLCNNLQTSSFRNAQKEACCWYGCGSFPYVVPCIGQVWRINLSSDECATIGCRIFCSSRMVRQQQTGAVANQMEKVNRLYVMLILT